MRSASTVSGPLLSVSTPASQQNRFAAVHLLTGQLLYFIVEGKSQVKEVQSLLTPYMIAQGMQDIHLFGLAFILDDEYLFADPECKLSKYSPKGWKSSSTYGLDQNGQPLLQLHLRVKIYVDTTKSLRDDITRQHFYLQLRKNILDRGGITEDGDERNILPLVAIGLQADLGDHTDDTDISSEVIEQYLPSKVFKNKESKVKQTLCTLHKSHKGVTKSRALAMFVQEASVLHKSHLYRLRLRKTPLRRFRRYGVWVAIGATGIQFFHESLTIALTKLFFWGTISKLGFDRKKFELKPLNEDRLVYYTNSEEKSKRMLALCRETHQYCMNEHPRLLDAFLKNKASDKNAFGGLKWTQEKKSKSKNVKVAVPEKKCENGGCSDSSISTVDPKITITVNKEKVTNGSISSSMELGYSHTAENSAVSELDYSVQSAQDSSDAYLIYRNPRARAAYVENSNQSAHTSSGVYTCASYSSASKGTASVSYTTENCSSVDCNDSGDGGDYNKAIATDVQSDVRMSSPAPPDADSAYSPSLPPDTVAASSVSADDGGAAEEQVIGAVDDCDGTGAGDVDNGTDELYDLSAAATSDSSYCVGGGATTATTTSDVAPSSSSSKCGDSGCGKRCALDGYADAGADAGGRSRSGSVVSNSGSFRGDGSDPSEGGRGALLSADELSDLIVGRKTLQTPRKGFYPSRPTTSSTLDSDSDYVTLPPPMNFVTGAPSLSNLSLANFDCGTGTAAHWDVLRPYDLLADVPIKFCGGHHHHHHHHHQCVVNSNNYLDVHKSGTAFYHHIYPTAATALPPLLHARQPPPPPPRPKRFDLQLEQYKQQLRSDVDFVVYPLRDPGVSRQEYVEARLAHDYRQQVYQQYYSYYGRDPPSYLPKAHQFGSTPNVAAAMSPPPPPPPLSSSSASSTSLSHQYQHYHHHHHHHHHNSQQPQPHQLPPPLPPMPPHLKYASNQNLLFPTTVAAAANYAAQHHHHHRLQQLPLPLPVRTYSHDDLLATTVAPAVPPKLLFRRRPPPPPPPVTGLQKPAAVIYPQRTPAVDTATTSTTTATAASASTVAAAAAAVLDIEMLREQSRSLDLPLISALCNDQTLLKQTNTMTTENKGTQTMVTANAAASSSHQPSPPSSSSLQPSPPSSSSLKPSPPSSSSLQPSTNAPPPPLSSSLPEQQPTSSGNTSNCTRCTNGTASFSSPPPPSFLSTASSAPVAAAVTATTASTAAVVKTAKSKTNYVKIFTNNI